MEEKREKLHKDVDDALGGHYKIWEKYCREDIPSAYRYFAADIIADKYNGTQPEKLACACQCFLYSRLAHRTCEKDPGARTLVGDYFGSLAPLFRIENKEDCLSELFSDFTIKEISEEMGEKEGSAEAFEERYSELFVKAAEVSNE